MKNRKKAESTNIIPNNHKITALIPTDGSYLNWLQDQRREITLDSSNIGRICGNQVEKSLT
jgi:hypothetical protein